MRAVLLTLVLLLVTGCVAGNPTAANPQVANPAFSKAPFLFSAAVIDMRIDPKNAAEFILNPTPLGQDGYPLGMVVTIEVLPKEGWRVDDWAGPVFDVAGNVAKITMGSSHTVVARMKRTGPMATPTDTSIPPTDTGVPQPTYTPLSTSTDTELSHYSKGEAYFRDTKYEQAVSEFTNAVRLDPGFAAAFEGRCLAYFDLAEKMRALDDCNKAILLNPYACCAHYIRAVIYGDLGQYQKAVQDLDQAIRIDPLYAAAYEVRGESYRFLGQYTKADADHAKACSLDSYFC